MWYYRYNKIPAIYRDPLSDHTPCCTSNVFVSFTILYLHDVRHQ